MKRPLSARTCWCQFRWFEWFSRQMDGIEKLSFPHRTNSQVRLTLHFRFCFCFACHWQFVNFHTKQLTVMSRAGSTDRPIWWRVIRVNLTKLKWFVWLGNVEVELAYSLALVYSSIHQWVTSKYRHKEVFSSRLQVQWHDARSTQFIHHHQSSRTLVRIAIPAQQQILIYDAAN